METVKIILFNKTKLQIQTDDIDYLEEMKDAFTRFVTGAQFSPKFKAGKWNGKVSLIDEYKRTFPYGILMDYIRVHKNKFPHHKLEIDQEVKDLFSGPNIDIKYDLELYPRPYQKDCIEACLQHTKGIIRSATASGKSLIIAYIIRNLMNNGLIKKSVIIVPTTSLVAQFYQDLVDEYGFEYKEVGMAFTEKKQFDRNIVISTWQTLKNYEEQLNTFDAIIVDETHGAKAHEMMKILSNTENAKYRLGFTGTMHSGDLDNWNTKAYIGPIIREYSSGFLADEGWVSKCIVNIIDIEYKSPFEGDKPSYHDIRNQVFRNDYRMAILKKLVSIADHNILVLIDKVEKEGEYLKDYLSNVNKEVVFLSGKDKIEVREKWRKECMKRKDIILIATYGIFQMGINIPNLKYVILASPFKAKIRILQSIGRALRKHSDKEKGAFIFDIHDMTKYLKKYGDIRYRYYSKEKFEIRETKLYEGDSLSSLSDFLKK